MILKLYYYYSQLYQTHQREAEFYPEFQRCEMLAYMHEYIMGVVWILVWKCWVVVSPGVPMLIFTVFCYMGKWN